MVQKESQPLTKPLSRRLMYVLVAFALSGGAVFYTLVQLRSHSQQQAASTTQPIEPAIIGVAALGRLEPQGEVIRLSAPTSTGSNRVTQLLIKEGDRVRKDQTVAIMESHDISQAALNKAKVDVEVASSELARVKAGAKTGDIQAQKEAIARLRAELEGQIATQKATIARITAEVGNAEIENQRYQELYKAGAVAASQADTRRLRLETAQQQLQEAKETLNRTIQTTKIQLDEAKATLNSVTEVRPVDVQVAQAQLESAIAVVKQRLADYELTSIRSPIAGQVLEVNIRPGEAVGNQGIANIGKTNQMYVVAEVYETDIQKVRIGQPAVITSAAFTGKLQGTVSQIGLQVDKQDVFDVNPQADTDSKVVDVKIRLKPEDSKKVADLTNLQVQVLIKTVNGDQFLTPNS
ncbi:ABC exporter membrane fusion protein [Rivularia sp. UHCC 0363]|uniref:ABC exporter membrane fusion protein n=1 Tax=Rivularia sp. UHCC 0363 TaxID=3110244 RepID=UPI002B1F39F6|nr:ABC exporter membrane fusion protein [Rivularia sp. UHCC 0363]MEA5594311.1 ABC exporter membrane fusion protein [Rivularia sp. UHCC 0363]